VRCLTAGAKVASVWLKTPLAPRSAPHEEAAAGGPGQTGD
jgi:hypothetical protein